MSGAGTVRAARAIGFGLCGALLLATPLLAAEPGPGDQPAAGTDAIAPANPAPAEPGTISGRPAPSGAAAKTTRAQPADVRIFEWINRPYTADRNLAVLGAPSTNAEAVGRVREGVEVFVVGVVAGGEWLQLRMPDGSSLGYVKAADFPAVLGQPASPRATTAQAAAPPPAEAPAPAAAAEAAAPEQPAEGDISGHATVVDTATLQIGDRLVSLYGIAGLDGQAAAGLQQYIDAAGGSVICHPQGDTRHVCTLPNNTDVAMAALINGAAMLGQDAPDAYLAERNDAVRNQRGMWGNCSLPAFVPPAGLPPELMQVYLARLAVNPLFDIEEVGEGAWLIDGVPYAFIDGAFRGITFDVGRGGWGFQDREGRWHGAPDRLRAGLDRKHPHGEGLRHEAGIRSEGGRGGHEGHEHGGHEGREAGLHGEGHFGGHGFMQPHAHGMGGFGGSHHGGGGRRGR